ncbi:MAG: universal stress protein [Pseudomonadota bacterium]
MNKKIHKILACVDFSEYSAMVLEYALELASQTGAQIVIINVLNQKDIDGVKMACNYCKGAFSGSINVEDYITSMEQERRENLKQLLKTNSFDETLLMNLKFDKGVPSECILNAVDSENIDLVVMANKGRGNIARVLFGSAAEKVFRHSPVPVISVRDRKRFKRAK